jgi:hypothetical protein
MPGRLQPFTGVPVFADASNPSGDWGRDSNNRNRSPRLSSYFGAAHTGGMNGLLADGNLRMILLDLQADVLQPLPQE